MAQLQALPGRKTPVPKTKNSLRIAGVSEQEIAEVQVLFAEGQSKAHTRKLTGLTAAKVKEILDKSPLDLLRMPPTPNIRTLIHRIQQLVNIFLRDQLTGNMETAVSHNLNISRLTTSIKQLEEIDEAISLKAKIDVAEHLILWMLNHEYQGSLRQIEAYRDEHLKFL